MSPAVFLDRDGTVIEHVHHLTSPDDVRLISDAAFAIKRLQEAGYSCVLVTNQSVVGRGLLSMEGLAEVHRELSRQLASHSVKLDGVYACPVAPKQDDPRVIEHPERKPGPGMLLRAARELELNISRSWMIGDSMSDVLAGWNAGCLGVIVVQTGCGKQIDGELPDKTLVSASLSVAADLILRGRHVSAETNSVSLP